MKQLKNKKLAKELDLIRKLKDKLTDSVSVERISDSGFLFSFSNGFKLTVIPFSTEGKQSYWTTGFMTIHDVDYVYLTDWLAGRKKNGLNEKDRAAILLFDILNAFSKKESTKKKARVNYDKVHQFELKDLLDTKFKLNLDPRKDFFLFGSDQLEPRFKQAGQELIIPKKGLKVQVNDKSALIFEYGNRRSIDLLVFGFKTKKYIYPNTDIFTYVESSKPTKNCLVKFTTDIKTGTNKMIYLTKKLNKDIKLVDEVKFPYVEAHGRIFTLKRCSGGIYSLYDNDGEISIAHPDLLISLVK
jgi:hypothetical protein